MREIFFVIVAAGKGLRTGLKINKVFYTFKGKTVLERCIESVLKFPHINGIILVVRKKNKKILNLVRKYDKIKSIVEGGKRRMDSVISGLNSVLNLCSSPEDTVVMIHDAARPFVSQNVVRSMLKFVKPGTGVIPVIPVDNTLKKVSSDKIKSTVNREDMVEVQTPQAFILKDIINAYKRLKDRNKVPTDDAEVFERIGGTVKVVTGDIFSFKITWKEHLLLYKMVVKNRCLE